ncbi:hypothetical protein [Pseudonocardia hierapolitana]|uniref:hypothetical protein n=1 Tax=Pseudonocardia hierapolitana TaxID=1128676 RepID=UPI0011BEE2EF|nr:hypothetical protein [Pseudonocardia hierapolitana]
MKDQDGAGALPVLDRLIRRSLVGNDGTPVDVGEVDREDRLGLRGEELSPGRSGPSRCGVDAIGLEDLSHCRRGDRVAEPDELAVDASVAPP